MKALNEAAKVGLDTYLEAVTALEEAEDIRYFEANELIKCASEESGAIMRGYNVEFSEQIMDANARDEEAKKNSEGLSAAVRDLVSNVKKPKTG